MQELKQRKKAVAGAADPAATSITASPAPTSTSTFASSFDDSKEHLGYEVRPLMTQRRPSIKVRHRAMSASSPSPTLVAPPCLWQPFTKILSPLFLRWRILRRRSRAPSPSAWPRCSIELPTATDHHEHEGGVRKDTSEKEGPFYPGGGDLGSNGLVSPGREADDYGEWEDVEKLGATAGDAASTTTHRNSTSTFVVRVQNRRTSMHSHRRSSSSFTVHRSDLAAAVAVATAKQLRGSRGANAVHRWW